MGISWYGKIKRAFIEFLRYDLNYLKGMRSVYNCINYKNLCAPEMYT